MDSEVGSLLMVSLEAAWSVIRAHPYIFLALGLLATTGSGMISWGLAMKARKEAHQADPEA